MFDRPDEYRDDAHSPREAGGSGPARRSTDRPHHMVVNDGELLDIGPDAETIDETAAAPRTAQRSAERAPDDAEREPDRERP